MPLVSYSAYWVARAALTHRAQGMAVFLGRLWPQSLTAGQLRRVFEQAKFPGAPMVNGDDSRPIDDSELCRMLGFSSCEALDFDQSEGANYAHNLNDLPVPPGTEGRFGAVYNFGTMEHIFHVPNFLANVFHLLAPGGVVLHSAPSSNLVEHGFYQLSPTLFYDYYTANRFDILECTIVRHPQGKVGERAEFFPFNTFEHAPDPLYGKLNDGVYDVVFLARKTEKSTCDRIPTQFRYQRK